MQILSCWGRSRWVGGWGVHAVIGVSSLAVSGVCQAHEGMTQADRGGWD
jgi:hypothetical protein